MSKQQINYLLGLATLCVIWLYFNTIYVNANKYKPTLRGTPQLAPSTMKTPGQLSQELADLKARSISEVLKGLPQRKTT
ncbi:MAG: hypothetical protein HY767_02445, partial [Candidatus Omnitrophica bacterium]|nr:hypothetical protein [Candidatus Omnitrophota bacterium]